MRERVYLFDTTLRDGAQTVGVNFSLRDKMDVATLLDDLGLRRRSRTRRRRCWRPRRCGC
ncbi:hypothetical protein [Falsiroseomonas oryziterrae]|uniref:hypothetical protein n=1 Tax=Falsiroseomonas oryziterrae TaxID=2911368 RepID=UPI001F26E3B0|nr:hypothetical protein [Roseomonas sp. NPKOSM-4]